MTHCSPILIVKLKLKVIWERIERGETILKKVTTPLPTTIYNNNNKSNNNNNNDNNNNNNLYFCPLKHIHYNVKYLRHTSLSIPLLGIVIGLNELGIGLEKKIKFKNVNYTDTEATETIHYR